MLKLALSDGGVALVWVAKRYGVSRATLMAAAAGGTLQKHTAERLEAALASGSL
jgi:hypothetical protein